MLNSYGQRDVYTSYRQDERIFLSKNGRSNKAQGSHSKKCQKHAKAIQGLY